MPRIRVPRVEAQARMVMEALERGQLATGPHTGQLSDELSRQFGKRFVTLTANGFSALFAALRASVPPGEPVALASASTCFAMVNAAKGAGLPARFMDLDAATMSIGVPGASADAAGHAVVPDHFGLVPPGLSGPRGSGVLIEDAAQAFLSRRRQRTSADAVVLSFYPTKVVNGIDGGAVLTDDPAMHDAVQRIVSYAEQASHDESGRFNLRMPNLHAAFLLGTLTEIDAMERTLREVYARLAPAVRRAGLTLPDLGADTPTRLVARAPDQSRRDDVIERLNALGVEAARELLVVCPPDEAGRFPVMQALVRETLSIPFHAALTEAELQRIEAALAEVA